MKRFVLLALVACGKKAAPPAAAIPATAAFVDVTVIPMDSERELAHQTVLVDHDRIVAMGEGLAVPAGATKIDGAGKYLVPGLVDMHVHYNDEDDGLLYVANGVTTVRNMWGSQAQLDWRGKTKEPAWMGPSIYTAGAIVDGKPPVWPTATVLETPEAAIAEVDAQKRAGYDFIKVYNRLSAPVYDAIITEAKKQGIRVVGHVPDAVGIARAMTAQTTIEHLDGWLPALQDATSKAASLPREPARVEMIAHFDPTKLPALAKQAHDTGVANVPTLVVLSRIPALEHPEQLAARPEMKYVSRDTLAMWDPKQDFRFRSMGPADFATAAKGNALRGQFVKALHDAGAMVFAGTDTPNPFIVPGFSLHEELALLVAAGFTPFEALRAATSAPAAWLDRMAKPAAKFGTIATGARADLVLLTADPLKDISATTKRAGVMLRGTWYPASDLEAKLEERAKQLAAAPADPFANAPALATDPKDGPTIFSASYTMKIGGMKIGKERLAIQEVGARRVIVGQSASQQGLVTVREELSGGRLERLVIEAAKGNDKSKATATLAAGKLVIEGATRQELPYPADGLVDANLTATMIPFADRARTAAAKTTVSGKILDARGSLDDISYTFEPLASGRQPFEVTSRMGKAPGTYETDATGFPTQITLHVMGDIVLTRD
jgi:hypothetical protein